MKFELDPRMVQRAHDALEGVDVAELHQRIAEFLTRELDRMVVEGDRPPLDNPLLKRWKPTIGPLPQAPRILNSVRYQVLYAPNASESWNYWFFMP